KASCKAAAGRAAFIMARSPRWAPTSGTTTWNRAKPRASTRAKWPISAIMIRSLSGHRRFPFALLLQHLRHFGRHVVLVVLGQHTVGLERARDVQPAFGHDPLALAEKVREYAGIRDRKRGLHVGDDKAHRLALATHHAAFGHQAAQPKALARFDALRRHFARTVEKHDGVL